MTFSFITKYEYETHSKCLNYCFIVNCNVQFDLHNTQYYANFTQNNRISTAQNNRTGL